MGVEGTGTGCLQPTLDSSGHKVGMGTQAWGVCVCTCDGVNGAAERPFTVIGWGVSRQLLHLFSQNFINKPKQLASRTQTWGPCLALP